MSEDIYDIHPPTPRWTHIALRVTDIDATIGWYTENTPLTLLARREDEAGYGAWLGHDDSPDSPFLLVVSQFLPGNDPFQGSPHTVLGPFAHLGFEFPSRQDLEAAAERAEANGSMTMPLTEMPAPIGLIFNAQDPDGNTIEFSFDQGVYAAAQQAWG